MDADARTDLACRGGLFRWYVGCDDGGDDAAVLGPDAVAIPEGGRQHGQGAARAAERTGGRGILLRLGVVRNDRLPGWRARSRRDAAGTPGAGHTPRCRCGRPDRRRAAAYRVEGTSACMLSGDTGARARVAG